MHKSIYFIGIGGIGMSGLAELALRNGLKVAGSDINASENTKRLEGLGAKIFTRHDPAQLGGYELIVYSSAITEDNAEYSHSVSKGLKLWHRSKLLNSFCENKSTICITGTHGKTTCSALISHMLVKLGMDPTFVIGGILNSTNTPVRSGSSEVFIAEIDESDGSFVDFNPYISVVTNIDADHMEFYGTLENLTKSFSQFMQNTHEDGALVLGWDSKLTHDISEPLRDRRLAYGLTIGSDIRAINIKHQGSHTKFSAIVEKDIFDCEIPLIGEHNVLNALCALSVARALELDIGKACQSFQSFLGVKRRMSLTFGDHQHTIYDDYAHNPGKMAAAVSCLKKSFPNKLLSVAFQPHRYSRLETMYEDMLASLEDSDQVFILPVYTAGETTDKDFSPEKLVEDFKQFCHKNASACKSLEDAANLIYNKTKDQDSIVLTLGAGDVHIVGDLLKSKLTGG